MIISLTPYHYFYFESHFAYDQICINLHHSHVFFQLLRYCMVGSVRSQVEHTQGVYEAAANTVDDVITKLTPYCTGDAHVVNSAEISSV